MTATLSTIKFEEFFLYVLEIQESTWPNKQFKKPPIDISKTITNLF